MKKRVVKKQFRRMRREMRRDIRRWNGRADLHSARAVYELKHGEPFVMKIGHIADVRFYVG